MKHTIEEIKESRPHVRQRNLMWLNNLLDDAIDAIGGEYNDLPEMKSNFIERYLKRLDTVHINGRNGSNLVQVFVGTYEDYNNHVR